MNELFSPAAQVLVNFEQKMYTLTQNLYLKQCCNSGLEWVLIDQDSHHKGCISFAKKTLVS